MKKFSKKIISTALSLFLLLSGMAALPTYANAEEISQDTAAAIRSAAEAYVENKLNDSTKAGLLAAVKEAAAGVTLADSDYFMKHAVPGVRDDDTVSGYPISIPGSDGAVSAVFQLNGSRISFVKSFGHTEETIHINEVAVAGTSEGFTYSGKNVIGYSGTADKIVFPKGWHGAMTKLSDKTSVNNVKAVFIDTDDSGDDWRSCTRLKEYSYSGWESLIAVEFGENAHPRMLFDNVSKKEDGNDLYQGGSTPGIFSECPNLKYVKLPRKLLAASYTISGDMFKNCKKLENVIFYENSENTIKRFANNAFAYTALRDVFLPSWAPHDETEQRNVFGGAYFRKYPECGQLINYSENMTFARAAALVAASFGTAALTGENTEEIAKAAICGSHDAAAFAESLTYTSTVTESDYAVTGGLEISNGTDTFSFDLSKSKALIGLDIGYALTPSFSPNVNEYTASVSNMLTAVDVNAAAADGAQVISVSGNTDLQLGENLITVRVKTTEEKYADYTITVTRKSKLADNVLAAADTYVQTKQNEVTKAGLLQAVKAVLPAAELADEDFYIRHAIPGVTDNDFVSGAPLSIPGSDGSVSAVFTVNGERLSFNTAFAHTKQRIHISDYAIVGDSAYADYFEYDTSGNVTAIKKPVDKLIFPSGYSGGMTELPEEDSRLNADRVKVVIYNGSAQLKNKAFYDWDGLIAFQMGDQTHNQWGFSLGNYGTSAFSECDSLKYFKFPNHINASGYNAGSTLLPNGFFENDTVLENVIFPTKVNGIASWYNEAEKTVNYGFWSLKNTAIREALLPKINLNDGMNSPATGEGSDTFLGHSFSAGTRNIHYYADSMNLLRAASLMASALSAANCTDEAQIISTAKGAVTGSYDAALLAESLEYHWFAGESTAALSKGVLAVSDGTDEIYIDAEFSRTLSSVTAGIYELDTEFYADKYSYTVTVPYELADLELTAVPVEGAAVEEIRTDITKLRPIEIKAVNTNGENVIYTVEIIRNGTLSANNLVLLRKAILGVKGGIEVDIGGDGVCNIKDLIAMKKLLASDNTADPINTIHIASLPGQSSEGLFYSSLAYQNKQGVITDTLFDSVTFGTSTSWMYSYNSEVPKTHSRKDWNNFIYNNLFADNCNVNALELAAGRVKYELKRADYKVGVYLPLFYTQRYFESWGSVNGKTLDFTKNADRIAAVKWLVDEMISAFDSQKYSNLQLRGFYYISEGLPQDEAADLKIILSEITNYIRSKNLITYMAPYNGAYGSNRTDSPNWKDCGFDEATYQINYFPGAEALPNAKQDSAEINKIAAKAAEMGASIQMELCSATERTSIGGLKEYINGGIEYGYMNNRFISWWIQGSGDNLSRLCGSDDAYLRSAYDEVYKFIHKTLTVDEIVF